MTKEETIMPEQLKCLFNHEDYQGLLAKALDFSEPPETGEETNPKAKSKREQGLPPPKKKSYCAEQKVSSQHS